MSCVKTIIFEGEKDFYKGYRDKKVDTVHYLQKYISSSNIMRLTRGEQGLQVPLAILHNTFKMQSMVLSLDIFSESHRISSKKLSKQSFSLSLLKLVDK